MLLYDIFDYRGTIHLVCDEPHPSHNHNKNRREEVVFFTYTITYYYIIKRLRFHVSVCN
jgi:hypothetical protein